MATTSKYSNTNRNVARVLDDNYIYISHLDKGCQFWKLPTWPDEISDSMTSSFQQTSVLGRTAPVFTYSSSGPRTVQISIPLHRDLMDDINTGISNSDLGEGEDYVDNLLNALRAISLPRYNEKNKLIEPPMVALRLGTEIFIKGVLDGAVGITFVKPILSNGKYAKVDLSITIAEIDPYSAEQVYDNGGFRGVVQSLKTGMGLGN